MLKRRLVFNQIRMEMYFILPPDSISLFFLTSSQCNKLFLGGFFFKVHLQLFTAQLTPLKINQDQDSRMIQSSVLGQQLPDVRQTVLEGRRAQ